MQHQLTAAETAIATDGADDAYGWRAALAVLAIVHGALTNPLHFLLPAPSHRPVAQATSVTVFAVLLVSVLHALGRSAGFSATVDGGDRRVLRAGRRRAVRVRSVVDEGSHPQRNRLRHSEPAGNAPDS
ncbi:hypothetical protein [Catenulispora rubra]|uniref:hypothetical protein n=1 Tax=Catenulispora rubra TaxID=280293 RepID=UPI00189202A7|nr:hypothetical protein [Catenulispora rubra]